MNTTNPFENAMAQLAKAAFFVHDSAAKEKVEILKQPQRILNVTIPVKMDDGKIRYSKAIGCNMIIPCGPYKGGIGFTHVSMDEVKALAFDGDEMCNCGFTAWWRKGRHYRRSQNSFSRRARTVKSWVRTGS